MTFKKPTKKELETIEPNYISIEWSYDNIIILPYKEGITLLSCLEKAQKLNAGYREKGHILPFSKKKTTINIVSSKEYMDRKICTAMDVSYDEYIENEKT
jgi:hypothetical protein